MGKHCASCHLICPQRCLNQREALSTYQAPICTRFAGTLGTEHNSHTRPRDSAPRWYKATADTRALFRTLFLSFPQTSLNRLKYASQANSMASGNAGPPEDPSQRTQRQSLETADSVGFYISDEMSSVKADCSKTFTATTMISSRLSPSLPDATAESSHTSPGQEAPLQSAGLGLRMAEMYTPEVMARRGGRAQHRRSTSVSSGDGGPQSDGTRATYKTVPKQQRRSQPGPAALRAQKPHGCIHCTRRFTTVEELQVHQANHTHPCPVAECGRVLTGADTLHDHMKRHTDVREFACQVVACGAAFKTAGDLYQHMRQSHNQVLNR